MIANQVLSEDDCPAHQERPSISGVFQRPIVLMEPKRAGSVHKCIAFGVE